MVRYVYQKTTNTFEKLPKYIYQTNNGSFEIRKRIGGVLLYWGVFSTLEEAKLYRAYYVGKKWMISPIPKCKETQYIRRQGDAFIIVKTINGHQDYFGTFSNLEDAKVERDICVACNWDFDKIVEFDERILVEVE